jgi:DNA-binding response OmpR family regulator
MFNKTVLVVDDEPDIRELLAYNLSKEGYNVKTFPNPVNCLEYIRSAEPDIILSDWLMPEMDGLEFCRKLKLNNRFKDIPLIMITCKADEADIVTALEIGADDYLIKPFRIKELISRMKKIIRNHEITRRIVNDNLADIKALKQDEEQGSVLGIGPFSVNYHNYQVMLNGTVLELTLSEFKILSVLLEKPDKIFSRLQLIQRLNGEDYLVTERTIDVKIVNLRKKLGSYQNCIKTVRSVGYKFSLFHLAYKT